MKCKEYTTKIKSRKQLAAEWRKTYLLYQLLEMEREKETLNLFVER